MSHHKGHHYVPVFLLKKWCVKNKIWCYGKGYKNKIIEKEIKPDRIASEKKLNSLKTQPFFIEEKDREIVEKKFSDIDNRASTILNNLLNSGIDTLTKEDKNIWLKFILLLPERNPSRLKEVELFNNSAVQDIINKGKKQHKETYEKVEKLLSNNPYNMPRTRLLKLLKDDIDNPYEWKVLEFKDFLITTYPIIFNLIDSYSEEVGLIEIALSPKKLLICFLKDLNIDNNLILNLIKNSYNKRLLSLRPKNIFSFEKIRNKDFLIDFLK